MGLDQGDSGPDARSSRSSRGASTWSILSVVLGLLWIGGIGSCLAIVAGVKARRLAEPDEWVGNRLLAFLGIALGTMGTVLTAVFFVTPR
jgi:hypothetical protein